MHYNEITYGVWDTVEDVSSLDEYDARPIDNGSGEPTFIYLFIQNREYHLIIKNVSNIKTFEDPAVNGLALSSKNYVIENEEENYIDLRLKNEIYLEQFSVIVREICSKIFEQQKASDEAIYDTLMRWRTFWASIPREEMSDEKQLGLFCELKFLSYLINNNHSDVLNTWKGPGGYKHDFLLEDKAFEIKGTFKGNHTHSINGIDQLKRPDDINLYMVSFSSVRDDDSAENLQNMVELIEEVFQNNPEHFEEFHKLLKKAGYNKLHSDKYIQLGIKIVEQNCYEVDENFPRLISSFLNTNLSERVSKISYTINLDGINTIPLNDTFK